MQNKYLIEEIWEAPDLNQHKAPRPVIGTTLAQHFVRDFEKQMIFFLILVKR